MFDRFLNTPLHVKDLLAGKSYIFYSGVVFADTRSSMEEYDNC